MRVLLAGASGAVGTPLTGQLIAAGHQVVGITRSQVTAERLRAAGAEAVVADVMDRDNLLTAVHDVRADAVMHQLTALGTRRMRGAMQGTNDLRTRGTAHLLAAARAVGAHRFLTQSIVLGYGYRDHGAHVITEDDPFAEPTTGRQSAGDQVPSAPTSRSAVVLVPSAKVSRIRTWCHWRNCDGGRKRPGSGPRG